MAGGINPVFKMLKKTEFPGHLVLLCVHACLPPFTVRAVVLQLQGEGDQLVPGLGNLKDDADQS